MTFGVRVCRRFRLKDGVVERHKLIETPCAPTAGMVLVIDDETPPLAIASVILHARPMEWSPGFSPVAISVTTTLEPGERVARAEEHGWRRLNAPDANHASNGRSAPSVAPERRRA
jgi:hypothetical protein